MWLWLVVLISFAFPIMPKSNISFYNLIENDMTESSTSTAESQYSETADIPTTTDVKISDIYLSDTPHIKNEATSTDKQANYTVFILNNLLFTPYLLGALTVLSVFIVSYIKQLHTLKKSEKVLDAQCLDILLKTKKHLGIKKNIKLIHGETPMLCGIINPYLVLPKDCNETEQKFIITHELCHLKHNDVILIWLAAILLCLFWFNPVMWICFLVFRKDVEVYCDERVLKITDERKEYASLLLKTALRKNKFAIGTTSLQNGEKEVERRIKHIALYKKPATIWILIITVIAVVIGAVFLTNAKDKKNYVYDFNHLRNPGEIYIYDANLDLFNKFRENYDYDYMINRCKYVKCHIKTDDTENIYVEKENSLVSECWKDVRVRIGYPLTYEDFFLLTDTTSLSNFFNELKIDSGKIYDIAIFDNIDRSVKYCIWVNTDNAEYIIRVDEDGSLKALIDTLLSGQLQTYTKVEKIEKNVKIANNISMSEDQIDAFTERIVGSVMAEIDYADQDKIVFHYLDSLFVYDYVNGKKLHTFDLSKLNCNTHSQGDSGITVRVHAGGSDAYLMNYGPEEETKELDNYMLDLIDGAARVEPFAIVKPDTVFKDTNTTVKDAKGWFSNTCILGSGDTVYYLTTETSSMSGLKLCTVTEGVTNEYYIFQDRADINYSPELKKSEDHDLAKKMLDEFMKITLPENSIVTEFRYERYYDYDEFGPQTKDSFMLKAFIPNDDYNTLINQLDSTMSKSRLTDYGIYDDLRHVAGWWRFDPVNLTDIYDKTVHFEGYGQRIQYIRAFITKHNDGYLMFFSY